MCFIAPLLLIAQDEEDGSQQGGKIQERMREYIQTKLSLTKAESERFAPVFVRYFREFAQTHRQYKGDGLVLKQRIIELRIRYRTSFREILDENRANKIFKHEDAFRQEAIRIIKENRRNNRPAQRGRLNSMRQLP